MLAVSCSAADEPDEIAEINFSDTDFTIRNGIVSYIPFTGGSGAYELSASDPAVLGKYGIDIETHKLTINPAKTGESTLTIKDVDYKNIVTLNITVTGYYIPFKVEEITGKNINPAISVGNKILFIRNNENSRPVEIYREDQSTHKPEIVATGNFDIFRDGDDIFIMQFVLSSGIEDTPATYEYKLGGDGVYMDWFKHIFGFEWGARSIPPRQIRMTLTAPAGDCTITCLANDD